MRRMAPLLALALLGSSGLACGDEQKARAGGERLNQLIASLEKAEHSTFRGRYRIRSDTRKYGRMRIELRLEASGSQSRLRASGTVRQGRYSLRNIVLIMRDGVGWYGSPAISELLPIGKHWVRTTDPSTVGARSLTPEQLGALVKAAGEITSLGREEIRGSPVRHLEATVDLKEAASLVDHASADSFLRLVGEGSAPLHLHVWIQRGGLPVRYRVFVQMPRPGGGRPQDAHIQLDVAEYGVRVDADPPPAREVVAESELD